MRELQANYHQLSKYINSYLSVELLGGEIYKGILVHNNPSQKLFVLNNVRFGSTKFNGIHNFLYSQTYKIKFLTKFNDEVPNLPYEQDDDLVYEFRNHHQNDQDDQVEIDFSSLSFFFLFPILYICLDSEFDDLDAPNVHFRPEALETLCQLTKFTRKELQMIYRGFKQVKKHTYRKHFHFININDYK